MSVGECVRIKSQPTIIPLTHTYTHTRHKVPAERRTRRVPKSLFTLYWGAFCEFTRGCGHHQLQRHTARRVERGVFRAHTHTHSPTPTPAPHRQEGRSLCDAAAVFCACPDPVRCCGRCALCCALCVVSAQQQQRRPSLV